MTFGKPHGYNSDSTLKLECNGKYWEIIHSLGTSKWLRDPTPVFLGGSKISHDSGVQPSQIGGAGFRNHPHEKRHGQS